VPKRTALLLFVVALAALAALTLRRLADMPAQADEHHHSRQVRAFCDGDLSLDRKITMVPGWHLLAAGVAGLTGDCSLAGMRRTNAGLGVLSGAAFLWAALALPTRFPFLRSLQYFVCPVLFPYQFLAYTEVATLLLLLVAAGFLLRGRAVAAGLVVCASLLLRQTNVVWLLLVALCVLAERPLPPPRVLLLRLWPCGVGLAGFAAFVLINGGIALGDAQAHRAGIYPGNVAFTLLVAAIVFLPHNVYALWSRRARLRAWWLVTAAALLAAWFLAEFGPAHAYNRFPGFARNALLLSAEDDVRMRAGLLMPLLVGLGGVLVTRLARPGLYALYPAALLSLLPIKLIDQRYGFPFLALFLLFREDDPRPVEAAGLAVSGLLAAILTEALARQAVLL